MSLPELKSFGTWQPPALSPAGDRVACCVITRQRDLQANRLGLLPTGAPHSVGGAEVWASQLATGAAVCLTPGWGSSWRPRWSPDGRLLAFYSDRNGLPQLWIWEGEEHEPRLATPEPIACFFWFECVHWAPAGEFLAVKLRSQGWSPDVEPLDNPEPVGGIQVWTSPQPSQVNGGQQDAGSASQVPWYHRSVGDAGIVDLTTGEVRRLITGRVLMGMGLSPDGRHLACMEYEPGGDGLTFTLHLCKVDGSEHRAVATAVPQGYGNAFSWSPDGSRLAYTSWSESAAGELFVYNLEDDSTRTYRADNDVGLGNEQFPPVWSPDGTTVYSEGSGAAQAVDLAAGTVTDLGSSLERGVGKIIADTEGRAAGVPQASGTEAAPAGVVVWTRAAHQQGFWRVGAGAPVPLLPEAHHDLSGMALTGAVGGRMLVGVVEETFRPPELYALELASGQLRQVTRVNEAWHGLASARVHLSDWQDRHDRRRWSAVAIPADVEPGTPIPAIVRVYGGESQSGRIHRFGFGEPDLLYGAVSRGWALLLPDMPLPWDAAEPWREIVENVQLAVDAAAAEGLVAPGRLGIYGHSYGGYCVNVLTTRTNRFRAAVSAAGFSDLARHALTMPYAGSLQHMEWAERGYGRMRALPWEAPAKYLENSPVYRAHAVETPLLLLHGTEDTAVPVAQSEAMYAALYRLRKQVELVRYRGEGHAIGQQLNRNRADYWERVLGWFETHL